MPSRAKNDVSDSDFNKAMRTTNARKIAMERFASNFTSTKQIAESKDLCRHYAEHVDLLGKEMKDRDLELKEAKYEIGRLMEKNREAEELIKQVDIRCRATVLSLKKSLEVETDRNRRAQDCIALDCEKASRLLSALENHTQHGHHTVPSHTFVGLLCKIRQEISTIQHRYGGGLDSLKSVLHSDDGEHKEGVNNAPPASVVEAALLEMCKQLETDNIRLLKEVEVSKQQFESLQHKENSSTALSLIPHYRMAIIKERSYSSEARDEIVSLKEHMKNLREQLLQSQGDLEETTLKYHKEKKMSKAYLQERNSLMAQIGPALHDPTVASFRTSSDISTPPIDRPHAAPPRVHSSNDTILSNLSLKAHNHTPDVYHTGQHLQESKHLENVENFPPPENIQYSMQPHITLDHSVPMMSKSSLEADVAKYPWGLYTQQQQGPGAGVGMSSSYSAGASMSGHYTTVHPTHSVPPSTHSVPPRTQHLPSTSVIHEHSVPTYVDSTQSSRHGEPSSNTRDLHGTDTRHVDLPLEQSDSSSGNSLLQNAQEELHLLDLDIEILRSRLQQS